MTSFIGNFLLIFSISGSILVIFLQNYGNYKLYSKIIFWLSSCAIILSFFLLIFAFITSDFSIKNVFLNSSTVKPLIYKIAGSWASHEGSILLYTALLSLISYIYLKLTYYKDST